jgi:hypothetical protein
MLVVLWLPQTQQKMMPRLWPHLCESWTRFVPEPYWLQNTLVMTAGG